MVMALKLVYRSTSLNSWQEYILEKKQKLLQQQG